MGVIQDMKEPTVLKVWKQDFILHWPNEGNQKKNTPKNVSMSNLIRLELPLWYCFAGWIENYVLKYKIYFILYQKHEENSRSLAFGQVLFPSPKYKLYFRSVTKYFIYINTGTLNLEMFCFWFISLDNECPHHFSAKMSALIKHAIMLDILVLPTCTKKIGMK